MKELVLRDYQLESVEALRKGVAAGHRSQLLCAPTGSGKSVIATYLVREARRKLSRTAFVVDRIALCDQISSMFDEYGIEHGVIQADHWRYRPHEPVQVISTATMSRRDQAKFNFQFLVQDEAHIQSRTVLKFIADRSQMMVCALSATPFSKGLGKTFTNIVNVRTTNQLIAEGWLTPLKVYAARAIDMRGARIKSDGEWEPTEIEKRSLSIIGDIVSGWVSKTDQHFGKPVKTIVFSATVAHGDELCRRFQAAGYNFQQISYMDGNDDKRRAKIEEFRKPNSEIDGLVSCEALGRGFDVPDTLCMIAARPYRKSLSSWLQQVGRVMRPYYGKEYALLLDHSNNYIRFRDDMEAFYECGIQTLDDSDLDSRVRKEPEEKTHQSVCACGYVLSPKAEECPSCGMERPKRKNGVEHKPGELVEVGKGNGKQLKLWMQDKSQVQRELWGLALDRKKGDQTAAERFAKAQYKSIYGEWPNRPFADPLDCSIDVANAVKHNLIRYFKGRRV